MRYWQNPAPEDPEHFQEQVRTVCSLYQQAPALHQRGVHLMCCDEKTGMQAKAAGSSYPTARARIRRASESLVRLVADLCDVEEDLGKKDRRGILRSTASRAAFLADPRHRIRFVYTPKHASWLNQIELRNATTRYERWQARG